MKWKFPSWVSLLSAMCPVTWTVGCKSARAHQSPGLWAHDLAVQPEKLLLQGPGGRSLVNGSDCDAAGQGPREAGAGPSRSHKRKCCSQPCGPERSLWTHPSQRPQSIRQAQCGLPEVICSPTTPKKALLKFLGPPSGWWDNAAELVSPRPFPGVPWSPSKAHLYWQLFWGGASFRVFSTFDLTCFLIRI